MASPKDRRVSTRKKNKNLISNYAMCDSKCKIVKRTNKRLKQKKRQRTHIIGGDVEE